MLERLEVRGLGIIDEVEVELSAGFSALTGETGAGKSLLVESLKLLSGQRAQSDLVRSGDSLLRVEGWFRLGDDAELESTLDDLGVDHDGELVVRREVIAGGRSRCWLNDITVTAAALARVAPRLLAIHGQHEQHGLAESATQRALVDLYAGHDDLLRQVGDAFRRWHESSAETDRLRAAGAHRRDRLDAIAFQIAEIETVDPSPGEDEELILRRQMLRHAARLKEASDDLLGRLTDNDDAVVDALARAERRLAAMAECGLVVDGAAQRLAEARVHAEEVAREVRSLVEDVAEDPAELEAVESRLHRLEQLTLKYGSPIDLVLQRRDQLLAERRELDGVEDRLAEAQAATAAALAEFDDVSQRLDESRREAGRSLAGAIEGVLAELNMAGTTLRFQWQVRPDEGSALMRDGAGVAFDAEGVETCELQIAANPGEEPRSMARIASGGELSRIHLALRTVLLGLRRSAGLTLLFDEVDSGLGGTAAAALAGLLSELAREHQVLVVTHLPQVAARATQQYLIEKVLHGGRAVTRVSGLDREGRESELARMLSGGDLTPSARAHARTLLEAR